MSIRAGLQENNKSTIESLKKAFKSNSKIPETKAVLAPIEDDDDQDDEMESDEKAAEKSSEKKSKSVIAKETFIKKKGSKARHNPTKPLVWF
jgi:hypothetical protein